MEGEGAGARGRPFRPASVNPLKAAVMQLTRKPRTYKRRFTKVMVALWFTLPAGIMQFVAVWGHYAARDEAQSTARQWTSKVEGKANLRLRLDRVEAELRELSSVMEEEVEKKRVAEARARAAALTHAAASETPGTSSHALQAARRLSTSKQVRERDDKRMHMLDPFWVPTPGDEQTLKTDGQHMATTMAKQKDLQAHAARMLDMQRSAVKAREGQ